MNKLIFDPLNRNERFHERPNIQYCNTSSENAESIRASSINTTSCTSGVKYNPSNWFYILPYKLDRQACVAWIEELKEAFPNFKLEVLPEGTYLEHKNNIPNTIGRFQLGTPSDPETGELISIKGKTVRSQGKVIDLFGFDDSLHKLVAYCKSKRRSDWRNLIEEFVNNKIYLEDNMSGSHFCKQAVRKSEVSQDTLSTRDVYKETFEDPIIVLDFFKNYFEANRGFIDSYLIDEKTEDRIIIKALYSKKRYGAEPYLCHILIRAFIAPELHVFLNQYYRVKELMPNIYFWNRVFLAQMGIEIFYYWWFTNQRILKMTTPEEVSKVGMSNQGAALSFMESFYKTNLSQEQKTNLYNWYKEEDLQKVYTFLQGKIIREVTLKNEAIGKFQKLRLSPKYKLVDEQGLYYFITGDDLITRRYLKKNFNN
jgi:hypothetical protein